MTKYDKRKDGGANLMYGYMQLKEKLHKNHITLVEVADLLEISEKSVRNKLKGITDFTITEALTIKKAYFKDESLEKIFIKTNSR